MTLTLEQLNVLLLAKAGALHPTPQIMRRMQAPGLPAPRPLMYGHPKVIESLRRKGMIAETLGDRITTAGIEALRSESLPRRKRWVSVAIHG